jgi:hypothetical protein
MICNLNLSLCFNSVSKYSGYLFNREAKKGSAFAKLPFCSFNSIGEVLTFGEAHPKIKIVQKKLKIKKYCFIVRKNSFKSRSKTGGYKGV